LNSNEKKNDFNSFNLSLDDQPEINEYIKYQRTIRELKDENTHLRDEMANLRKSMKSDKKQVDIHINY
jgi:hypothetical protein